MTRHPGDGRLWLISSLLALLLLVVALFAFGVMSLTSLLISKQLPPPKKAKEEQVVIVMAPAAKPAVTSPTPPAATPTTPRTFARTSADQESAPPEKADFIGDRDTVATSDQMPVPGAPAMPSQKGRDPLRPDERETTQSRVQEGDLAHDAIAQPMVEPRQEATPSPPVIADTEPLQPRDLQEEPLVETKPMPEPTEKKDAPQEVAKVEPAVPMIEGDVEVERNKPKDEIKPKEKVAESMPKINENEAASLPKPKEVAKDVAKESPTEPGFRGNQEKTKLSGSISRQGRSAQNVANTAMGRYHSLLSRAVEAEWHRNCTKYRDFITPGILTMRFVIDEKGAVRSVSVVEMIDAGEVQKGFTLNAIRQAKIPPIPADLKKELDGEPLELIYNFYF